MPDFVPTSEQQEAAARAVAGLPWDADGMAEAGDAVLAAVGPLIRRDALAEASTQIKMMRGSSDGFYVPRSAVLTELARLGGVEKEGR